MALNLKTFGIRSLSAAAFVVLLLGSLLWNYISFSLFFLLVSLLALNEFYSLAERLGARPFKSPGIVLSILIYGCFLNTGYLFKSWLVNPELKWPLLLLSFFIVMGLALFSKRENALSGALYTVAGIFYAFLPFALVHELVIVKDPFSQDPLYYPDILLGVIFLIWTNDTMAYIGGSLFGRHKMIQRISPGKTWEGTIFGILATFGMSFVIKEFLFTQEFPLFVALGLVVPVLATIGDLVESWLKRVAGIKDSGNIMPGHGGVLDRFDSFIFVTPFLVLLLKAGNLF